MADNYGQWYVTKMFTDAEAAAAASSNKITFLRMIASTDVFAQEDLATMTNNTISTIKAAQTALIAGVIPANGTYKVQGVFTNTGVTDDYLMNTILLVASYNGSEFLAAAQVAKQPFKMPAAGTTEQTVYTIGAQIVVSNTATVNLTLDPKALVTNESLKIITDAQAVKDAAQDEATKTLSDKVPLFATLADAQTFAGIKTFTEKIIGSITGTAEKAVALVTSRKLKVKLDSTTDKTFNGMEDVTDIGVSGVLQIANGGTGNANGLAVGQSSGAKLTATDDLNDIATTIQYTLNGETPLNAPTDAKTNYGFVIVQTRDDNGLGFVVQRYITTANNEEFIRSKVGQPLTWTAWKETVMADDSGKVTVPNTIDSGKVKTATIQTGYGRSAVITRIGNTVTITSQNQYSSVPANGSWQRGISTLPLGFRPVAEALIYNHDLINASKFSWNIFHPNGAIDLYSNGNIITSDYILSSGQFWITKDDFPK